MGSSASAPFFSAMGVLANSNLCPFLFALAIGIPSAVLYCSLLLVIVANFKHFSSPFFILIIIRAILLWRVGLPFVVAFSFIFPLPFTVPIFGLDMYIHVQNDNATFTIDFHKTAKDLHSSEIAAWSAVLFGIVCLFLNVATLLAYKLRSNYQQNDQNAANERKMTIYTVSTFFGQLLMAIFMVIRYISGTNFVGEHNNRFSYVQAWFNVTLDQADTLYVANFNQYPWVNDLSTVVIPAWLLLWASSKLRQIIAKKLQFVNRLPEHTMFVRQQIKFVSPQTQPINGICR
ncbi:hypothetical protein niasHT_032357 [Heterodera trifolii]|uniref:Serpentine receptor class gamma n=1 Tax=Heterodera trifolii TaxID=157864 RepID=A0ABD2HSA6_9BILA